MEKNTIHLSSNTTIKEPGTISFESEPIVNKVDVLIKALGTMVLEPQYEKDATNIAAKAIFTGTIQKPILEGDFRTKALNRLSVLIDRL